MCGIAGIIQPGNTPFGDHLTEKISGVLSHRGPDAAGAWRDSSHQALFVHCRLSIIDLTDRACQPLHFLDRYVIIHNGEIYNYIELRNELERLGYRFSSKSDTEVIAASFDSWGTECLSRFEGMFAFAIWDQKERRLFAARDRFGEKPFFFHFDGLRLYFASEMKALWAAGVSKKPNLKLLFNFLTIGYTANPDDPFETFFEGIRKLPPAHYFHCEPGGAPSIQRYWNLDPNHISSTIEDDEAIEKFRELFYSSVRRRLRSDVPVGSSLSGGLDSSSVLATMLKMDIPSGGVFHSFTAGFRGFEKDETSFARLLGNMGPIKQHIIEVDTSNFESDWNILMHHQEEPVGSASVYPQFKIFELAKKENVKVLLDGQGADEILAGYHRYFKWYWQELFRKGKLFRSGELKAAKIAGINERFGFRNMVAALFPDLASVILEKRYLLKALKHEDLHAGFVRLQSDEAYYTPPSYSTLNDALYFNTCVHGLEELLRYADRNSMAHGREVRLPFLDHELVEFLFSIPSRMKIRKGFTKWILRESMKNDLPSAIVWRKEKIGFEPPQRSWMSVEPVQCMIRDAKSFLVKQEVLNKKCLTKPIQPAGSHEANNYDWRYLSAAWLFK